MINLINEEKTSLEKVIENLKEQEFGTSWAEKTNPLAINYARHLGEVYGDFWYKGFLPKEYFLDILLPKHGHLKVENDNTDLLLFPDGTSVKDAVNYFNNPNSEYPDDCLEHIKHLKEEIKIHGFTSSLVLVVINGALKHVDGLHRMLALSLLIQEEGYEYKPLHVFLLDSTK